MLAIFTQSNDSSNINGARINGRSPTTFNPLPNGHDYTAERPLPFNEAHFTFVTAVHTHWQMMPQVCWRHFCCWTSAKVCGRKLSCGHSVIMSGCWGQWWLDWLGNKTYQNIIMPANKGVMSDKKMLAIYSIHSLSQNDSSNINGPWINGRSTITPQNPPNGRSAAAYMAGSLKTVANAIISPCAVYLYLHPALP